VRAFDAQALDYVLKPIDPERFRRALQRARAQLHRPGDDFMRRVALAMDTIGRGEVRRYPGRLAIRSGGRVRLLDIDEVERIVAAGNQVEVHCGEKRYLQRETLTSMETRLDPERFVRVSRAAIVGIDHVREVQALVNGDFVVIMKNASQVNGSRRYRNGLERLLG
jgi:two-component system, LytTR family, response regulator